MLLTGGFSSVNKEFGGYLMGKKRWMVSAIALLILSCAIQAQTVTQMGFIIKKGMPNVEAVAVLVNEMQKEKMTKEAQSAQLITKVKYFLITVSNKSEIAAKINDIKNIENVAALIIADETILTESTVKFIAQKLASKKTPVVSNRQKDTLQGILMTIFQNEGALEKHINKISMSALGVTLSDEFLAECVIDVE
jgi:hypothetical protein